MKTKRGIPFLEITAKNNYEFGYKLGKELSESIKKRIAMNKEVYWRRSTNKQNYKTLIKKARKFILPIKKNFPHLLLEAKGIAEGAGVDFNDILVIICDEEIVDFGFTNHCTTVALKTEDNKYLLGHNEDWFPEFRNNGIFLVRGKIRKNKFLALGYVGSLVGSGGGMNSFGIGFSDTSFYFSRFEYKVPRSVHLRALLDIKNPKQALNTLNCEASIISNTVFVFKKHGLVDIEELWSREQVFKPKDYIIHTNHPLLLKDRTKAHAKEEKESVLRYERAFEIIQKQDKLTINSIKKVLSDHKADICGHLNKKQSKDITVTLLAFILNPKEKWMMLCCGNPCRNKFKKFYL